MRIEVATHYCPALTSWHVRRTLKWISQTDIEGLGFIRLMDEEPEDPEAGKKPAHLRGFTHNGRYLRKRTDESAHILLYTHDLYLGIPSFLKLTPVATLQIAFTLAHEVGHHVIANRGYIYQSTEKYKPWGRIADPYEEKMADAYAFDVIEKMYTTWYYKFGRLLARILSNIFYKAGIQEYWDGNYERAAYCSFRAHTLNRENLDAGYAYRQDMELLTQQTSASTSTKLAYDGRQAKVHGRRSAKRGKLRR